MLPEGILGYLGVLFVVSNVCLAFLAGFIAGARGRNEGGWFVLTLLLGVIAILALALYPVDQDALALRKIDKGILKYCPYCHQPIPAKAVICSYCRSRQDLDDAS